MPPLLALAGDVVVSPGGYAHEMDHQLLERPVKLARTTKEFDRMKLPKTLRVAIDSAPLEGAAQVEDTPCSRTRRGETYGGSRARYLPCSWG